MNPATKEYNMDDTQTPAMKEEQDVNALTNALYDLLTTQWNMQTENYNIEDNYPELIPEISLAGKSPNDIVHELEVIKNQCQTTMDTKKPIREQRLGSCFSNNAIAPIPNNPVVAAFLGAIMHGGKDARCLDAGWTERDGRVAYETVNSHGGKISIGFSEEVSTSIEEKWKIVESLSLFTADVTVGILGHICKNYCENRIDRPILQETMMSSTMLLKDRGIKAHGKKSWGLKEAVNLEIQKIQTFQVSIQNLRDPRKSASEKYNQSFHLISSDIIYRMFDKNTLTYIPTVWKVRPGSWASLWMSSVNSEFIGKLHKNIYQLDHRDVRPGEGMAKKLAYMLFTVPGGTYYLKKGVSKNIKACLSIVGEYISPLEKRRGELGRRIRRLLKGLGKLSEMDIIDPVLLPSAISESLQSNSKILSERTLLVKLQIKVKEESGIAPSKEMRKE